MNTKEIIALNNYYIMNTYARQPIALKEGKGAVVWDVEGRSYIDCVAGIAVNNLGHAHPRLVKTICQQAQKIIHTSNLYYTEEQVKLAELLAKVSPHRKAFFCNSGAEANEGAIKLARKYTGKGEIIAMDNSFHGRTITTITATGQKKYQEGFGPLCPGFKHVPYADVEAVSETITNETAAVLVEPVQGEGGVIVPPDGYLIDLKNLCHENNVLLIFDEVQTGFGRTGEMFASQTFKVTPDITTLAKAIAGGFPMGAVMASDEVGAAFEPGDHGATFGGDPLACATASTSIEIIHDEELLLKSRENGSYFQEKLMAIMGKHSLVKDVRGVGLMLGMEMNIPCANIVDAMRDHGVLVNCAADKVLRFVPPLVISHEQIDIVTRHLDEVLESFPN
jgi:acetylornithine/N-succinyldiaminopimelate aminotransferase